MIHFNDKFVNVISTPRTGSVWFSSLMWQYCREVHGFKQLLTEPFNMFHYNTWYEPYQTGHKNHHEDGPNRFQIELKFNEMTGIVEKRKTRVPPGKTMREITNERMTEIHRSNKQMVLHDHAYPIDEKIVNAFWHSNSNSVIFVARKNKWEQLLSYGVAYHTKIFARFEGTEQTIPNPKEVIFPNSVAQDLCCRIEKFNKLVAEFDCPIIYYEDMNFERPEKTLELINIKWTPIQPLKLPLKQTPGDKEIYFKNLDEIREIYRQYFGE